MFAKPKSEGDPVVPQTPERDKVREWRHSECIRIVGLDHAQAFADSRIDLHLLERAVKNGATPAQLKEWLL